MKMKKKAMQTKWWVITRTTGFKKNHVWGKIQIYFCRLTDNTQAMHFLPYTNAGLKRTSKNKTVFTACIPSKYPLLYQLFFLKSLKSLR